MASAWDKLRQARVQRFVVGWAVCLAVLYAAMCVLVDLSAKSVLEGGEALGCWGFMRKRRP